MALLCLLTTDGNAKPAFAGSGALRLQQLRKRLSTETEMEAVDKLEEAFQGAITRLRHLMFNLRPVALERSGLAAALRAQLEQIQTETGLGFELANQLTAEPPPETRVILYRIAMEALTNARKHAGAHLVLVRLENVHQGWQVQIDDDGSGFTPTENGSAPGHLGLTAMRERAQIAGGWWKLGSQSGQAPASRSGRRPFRSLSHHHWWHCPPRRDRGRKNVDVTSQGRAN
jgi:signal transduction histidine kinase